MELSKVRKKEEILSQFHDGQTIVVGGQAGTNLPYRLIELLIESGVKHITLYSIDAGDYNQGIGRLVHEGVVDRMITTHIGTNPEAIKMYQEGKLQIEFNPMGSYIERIRCGGYGLGGVLTRTGLGTVVEEHRKKIVIDGEEYLIEPALKPDISISRARRADPLGNLAYRGTGTASHPNACMAGKLSIVECDHFCDLGEIGPDEIRVPGMYVDILYV